MENPFSGDKNNPFQTPFQPAASTGASGIKPFAAVDLAPPAGQNGQRHSAPGPATLSPFIGGDFTSAFLSRDPPAAAIAPHVGIPPGAAPLADRAAASEPVPHFAIPAVPEPVVDFTPVAAARQSNIMSISDFNEALSIRKPAFFLTTTPTVEGYPIQSYLGLVSVEVVVPKDILFQNPAAYGELHRMKAAEDLLQKVKNNAMEELGERAKAIQADGVVGITLVFSQFDAIVCLCSAVGTAVKIAE